MSILSWRTGPRREGHRVKDFRRVLASGQSAAEDTIRFPRGKCSSGRGILDAPMRITEGTMGVILHPATRPYVHPGCADFECAGREKVSD